MKDKILIALFSLFAVLLIAHSVTQRALAQIVKPAGEVIILVNSSTNLNAKSLRVVGGKWGLDSNWSNWTQVVVLEAWNDEVPSEVAGRKTLTLNFWQMKALYNAADPSAALQNAALSKAALVKKTP